MNTAIKLNKMPLYLEKLLNETERSLPDKIREITAEKYFSGLIGKKAKKKKGFVEREDVKEILKKYELVEAEYLEKATDYVLQRQFAIQPSICDLLSNRYWLGIGFEKIDMGGKIKYKVTKTDDYTPAKKCLG